MESVNTKTVQCLVIETDGTITPNRIVFDLPSTQHFCDSYTMYMRHNVIENMRTKCSCIHMVRNVAKAIIPAESYYHAFYESDTESPNIKFNRIASHIINNLYNNDTEYNKSTTNFKCYGNCYIIHLDCFYNLYDVGTDTFINLYNKVHTHNGTKERDYFYRLFKKPGNKKCYLHSDIIDKNNCITM